MKINKLNLESFGKFKNKEICLSDGINIIYGENETGKSTIHNFINGMLYGFLKPYIKTTQYLPEHEKYRPWDYDGYKGSIEIGFNGKNLKIQRNFTKGVEETKVFDLVTGEEVTKSFDMGKSNRVFQPGMELFGVNSSVFTNTLSIGQLSLITDSRLADEIRDRITQSSLGSGENISVEKALERIDIELKEIGSLRAPTSDYYKLVKQLESINEELKLLKNTKENYQDVINESTKLKEKKKIYTEELNELKEKKQWIQIWDRSVNIRKREDLILRINENKKIIEELKEFKDIDEIQLEQAMELTTQEKIQGAKLEGIIENMNYLEDKVSGIKVLSQDEIERVEELILKSNTFLKYDALLENEDIDELKNKIEIMEKSIKKSKILIPLILILYIILLVTTFSVSSFFLRYGIHFLLIPVIYLMYEQRKTQKKFLKHLEFKKIHGEMMLIMDEAKASSKEEYYQIIETSKSNTISNKRIEAEREELLLKLDEVSKNYRQELDYSTRFHDSLTDIYLQNKVLDIEEFKEGLKKHNHLVELQKDTKEMARELEELKDILTNAEQGIKHSELLEKPLFYDQRYEIEDKIDKISDGIPDLEVEISKLDEAIRNLEDDLYRESYLKEEVLLKNQQLEKYDNKIKSLLIAKDRILSISLSMHREFAPLINKEVGDLLRKITNGKYDQVKIDNELNLSLIEKTNNRIIQLDSLSGGTIDQLYFSLRIALSNQVVGKNMPLFLDESFAHYDYNRLVNILNFLVEISRERQIFIFTCHFREKDVLDNLNYKYNIIELS